MAKKQLPATQQLPVELLKITETSGIAITEAQSIGFKFAPFMQRVNEISIQIQAIEQTNPTAEDAALARKLRLSLVENRGTKGLATVHKELKAESLVRGRLIDSFRNVVDQSSEMSELIAERIEKHSERMEAQRMAELSAARIELLIPYGTDTTYLPLGKLTDEQFDKILANEKLLFEAKKAELERLEAQRLENERIAEENRKEAERLRIERENAIQAENYRIKKELEKERAETAEREKLRIEAEQKAEKQRELNRIRIGKVALNGLIKIGFVKDEHGVRHPKTQFFIGSKHYSEFDTDAEMTAWFTETESRLSKQLNYEAERKKQADILAEQQRLAKIESDKLLKVQAELQAKKDKEAKELAEKKAAELAALAAPDKIKIRALYDAIKGIVIPELQSEPGKEIAALTDRRIKELLIEISREGKKLI